MVRTLAMLPLALLLSLSLFFVSSFSVSVSALSVGFTASSSVVFLCLFSFCVTSVFSFKSPTLKLLKENIIIRDKVIAAKVKKTPFLFIFAISKSPF